MAGILRPAFYNNSSRETLLGTVGTTIAHEMSHGFDPYGIQYDSEGQSNCVLTPEDLEAYQKKVQRLTENLSRIELADGALMDGTRKLSEEAADLLGLRLVLNMASQAEGFDYDLFFRTLARCFFRSFKTREAAMDNYASDYHPAYYIRVNYTFSQFEEFYRTYPAIQEGTGMYYPPESRESLW